MTIAAGMLIFASSLFGLGLVLVFGALVAYPESSARFYLALGAVFTAIMGVLTCISCMMLIDWGH